jgi:hypothetical protein
MSFAMPVIRQMTAHQVPAHGDAMRDAQAKPCRSI